MSNPTNSHILLISNPDQSRQIDIIVCAAITWAIGASFVALRFYTRGYLLHNVLGMEDWFILVALVFSGATSAGMIEQAMDGLGKHTLDVDLSLMIPMARAGWYTILWYMLALLFTKISILLLYIRILSYQHARYAVYAIMGIVIFANGIWTLATVVTACVPLRAFWDRSALQGQGTVYCHSLQIWFANTGLHIGTDVLLYVLPLPVIVNLRIRARQKIFLYSIFGLGFLVCTISVVRLWDLVEEDKRPDFTYDNVSIAYLTCVEVNAAIACACCMTLKPLMVRVFPRLWGSRSDSEDRAAMRRKKLGHDIEAAAASPAAEDSGGSHDGNKRGPPTIGSNPSRLLSPARIRERSLWLHTTVGSADGHSQTRSIFCHNEDSGNLELLGEEDQRRSDSEKGSDGSSNTRSRPSSSILSQDEIGLGIPEPPEPPEPVKVKYGVAPC
ncbi:hypothetical protein V8F06_008145 [Rhypophila decipiens]